MQHDEGAEGRDDDAMSEAEYTHYASVLLSFQEYSNYELRTLLRRKKHLDQLVPKYRAKLSPHSLYYRMKEFGACIRDNQQFLMDICHAQLPHGPHVVLPPHNPKLEPSCPGYHFSKLRSTLHQCVRDWSEEGAPERAMCYDPILAQIETHVPMSASAPRILVPGAGLGRLALEIAAKGYAVQGNEFSYQMLFASNFILNHLSTTRSYEIHPFLHNPSNVLTLDDHLRSVMIPDISPQSFVSSSLMNADFSMCAGEFLDVYGNQEQTFDCIVTCFFIDAAPNVLAYIEAFERILKPGGKWINYGPLTYHWQLNEQQSHDVDPRYHESIELTYEDIKYAMEEHHFQLLHEEQNLDCYYTCNPRAMMRTLYQCVCFTAVKSMPQS